MILSSAGQCNLSNRYFIKSLCSLLAHEEKFLSFYYGHCGAKGVASCSHSRIEFRSK